MSRVLPEWPQCCVERHPVQTRKVAFLGATGSLHAGTHEPCQVLTCSKEALNERWQDLREASGATGSTQMLGVTDATQLLDGQLSSASVHAVNGCAALANMCRVCSKLDSFCCSAQACASSSRRDLCLLLMYTFCAVATQYHQCMPP